ncbi:hypothetical protein RHMOL_Rhmol02G0151300 [Rhododendron molle]|uniref:Uncharacterized protein n=1 Tax=Rhododendron molle TaxID=49168 RepID=A0ACC0PT06_RHOML|nr:hypothetical protein RHMOL_Rhmol02G0151300 [Rhododendron molle]
MFFAAVVRTKNWKPLPGMMPVMMEKKSLTPRQRTQIECVVRGRVGSMSKSVNSGEKRSGGIMMGRKSYT